MLTAQHAQRLLATLLAIRDEPAGACSAVTAEDMITLSKAAAVQFLKEPALLELAAPITVVGDLHGQIRDLMRIFDRTGMPWTDPGFAPILFLGDFVDRGVNSIEIVAMLFLLKVSYPDCFYLLRGNHEARGVNGMVPDGREMSFQGEVLARFGDDEVWRVVNEAFDCLPVAAVVGGRVFCVHGGISPRLKCLGDLRAIPRPIDVIGGPSAVQAVLTDLLWSDPNALGAGWGANSGRGVGAVFGAEATSAFCTAFGIDLIVRAHQVVDGYDFPFGDDRSCLRVFSASNYQGMGNYGAVVHIGGDLACRLEEFEPEMGGEGEVCE
jgi:serine/threonine-protein phosphatase PP1 catalytic subunit